nr:hypothetical protein [Tanacetum cinerariifolium]
PYTLSTVIVPVVPATENSLVVPEHTTVETLQTMSPENKAHYESKKEAILLILTGIEDEIYSTVDACKIAQEIENVGSPVVQQTRIQCFNCKEFGHFSKECMEPKRVKDFAYHKEKMLLCKQAEQGVPLQVEHVDWLADTDDEIDEQELEAHYNFMVKIQQFVSLESNSNVEPLEQIQNDDEYNVFANVNQHCVQSESTSNTCFMEKDDSDVTPDLPDMCENDIQTDQNAKYERVVLAKLIANSKLDVDENKIIQKQLKKANTSLAHELEQCKSILAETSKTLKNNICIKLAIKRSLQQTHISQASRSGADEGIDKYEQDDDDQDDNDDNQDSDNGDDDFLHPKLSTHDEEAKDEESFDLIVQTPSQVENSDDESNDDESHGMNVGGDEGPDAKDDDEELTMDMTIDQQVALEEALVPHASRLRIGKSNFPDVPDIYMQEFWATATVHHHSIHFKMKNKKRIVNLEYFREMLHICPRIPDQTFDELPFKEEILAFIRYLRHSEEIKKITNININKLHQAWRSFSTVINKCLSGKRIGYDCLRLSQAQILWGMYHKKNVDFVYLLWEYFVYQVEHKDAKKSNEMYYPRFTKVIINFFMTKDPLILRRNKVNWHHVRDDQMFTTIMLVSRHHNTQQFRAMLHIELTNEDIRNSATYKKYYAIASGAAPPEMKASVRKTHSSSDATMPPPMDTGTRLLTSTKGKQPTKSSKAKGLSVLSKVALTEAEQIKLAIKRSLQQTHISQASRSGADEGIGIIPEVLDVPTDESDKEISWNNDDESHGMNVGGDEGPDAKDDDEELYRDVNINLEGRDVQMTDVHSSSVSSQFVTSKFNPSPDAGIDSLFESTPRVDVLVTTTVVPLLVTAPTLPPPSIPIMSQFAEAFSSILGIVDRYIDHQMNEPIKLAVHIQSDRLRYEAQAKNEDFLNKLDENIQKIIKKQVKVKVSKILPKIENTVNEQLEAEVLTRSSNSSKTSYVVAADLSELELKKILIEKMKSNKSIHRSDKQRNLYKALVDAYECDKIILDTYGDTITLKRRRDDADKDKNPSLDQTGGPREEEKEKCQSQQVLQRKRHPRHLFYGFAVNRESARDVYSKRRIIIVTELQIVEWHNYKHLDWITVRRGVKSYQKKLNLTKLDTYRSDLKCKEAYTAYSNPRGFIYKNKDKQNKLMRIDELHKFSDGTLNDVRTALDDRLKGIQMKYLPQTIWRRSDKERAAAIIHAINKQLNTRRIMRSLEKFVGGRLYEGDFKMLQRTI